LSAEVLVAAVCQDPEEDETQAIDIDIHFVLDACRNLLVVDPQLGVCRFSHLSVQEYFEDHWDANQTNGTVAKVCLSLLNDPGNWEQGINGDKASQNPEKANQVDPLAKLLDYARRFWPTHVQNHGETNIDSRLSTLLKEFLGSMNESGPAYRSWYKMYTRLEPGLQRNKLLPEYKHDIVDPSYLASLGICLFGFNNVLGEWWEARSIDPEQRNCRGYSLLMLAVLGSSSNVVKNLVKSGADVNAQLSDGNYGSALATAAQWGNQDMVRLLLELGADVNAQLSGGLYGSALAAAVWTGNQDMVRLLLESGADVNAQPSGGRYGSALAAAVTAAERGNQDIVRLLLESGADVNAQLSGERYGSALVVAVQRGNQDMVRLLLESGADVNAQLSDGMYGSALAAAAVAKSGDQDIIRLLLESGADVNAQLSCGWYGSALEAAVEMGEQDTVRLLLESGADVNAQLSGGVYGSALAAATARDNQDIVQILLEYGVVQEKPSSNPPA
jgi:ankyrin repeat protein